MSTNSITTREFYNAVIAAAISDEVTAKAQSLLDSLDTRNEKRKSADSKEKRESANRRGLVLEFLKTHPMEQFTRDAIAAELGISAAQVTAACRVLGDAVTKTEVKIDKARRVVYQLA